MFHAALIFGQSGPMPQFIKFEDKPFVHDKNKIKLPQIRAGNVQERYYQQYTLSKYREIRLEKKINVIYDLDEAQKCTRIGRITTPYRMLASYVSDKHDCEISIRTLMDYTDKKGGNTLFINIFPRTCELGKFQGIALKCDQ